MDSPLVASASSKEAPAVRPNAESGTLPTAKRKRGRVAIQAPEDGSEDQPTKLDNGRNLAFRRVWRSLSLIDKEGNLDPERQRLLAGLKSCKVYARRWYILLLASLLAMLEGCIWNTWAPIAGPAHMVFGWNDADIARLANWGCIAYCVAAFPLSWVMDARGLRPAVIIAAFLITLGAGLRCITFHGSKATWLINAGHILNGLSSPVTFGAAPLASAIWFAPDQRTLATSIGTIASYAGIALSFVVGPQLVPQCSLNSTSGSNNTSNTSFVDDFMIGNSTSSPDQQCKELTIHRIGLLLYGEAACAGALLVLVLIYFPSRPPLPPSLSSSGSRLEFIAGLKRLLKKRIFWVVAIIYGLTSGVYSGWSAVLNIILGKFDISQSEAGWIGFYSTVAGAVGGLLVAWFADRYSGKMRQILIVLFMFSTLMFAWFTVTGMGVLTESASVKKISFYMSSIIGGFFINSTIPVFFEMAVEAAFPISEGIAAVTIMLSNNIFSIIVLFALEIPGIGISWMNWTLVGSCLLSVPVLAVLKDKYVRSTLDAMDTQAPTSPKSPKTSMSFRRANTAAPGRLTMPRHIIVDTTRDG